VIAIQTLAGPLDDAELTLVGDLYGRIDSKYRRLSYLRHLFVENPYGWALHSFARDGNDVVGHCAVIPVRARVGGEAAMSGKVEAYVVEDRYRRGRERGSERPVALDLLTAVSGAAAERGIDPLHAFLTPRVGAIFERAGYHAQATNARPYVLLISPTRPGVLASAGATGQRTLVSLAGAALRVAAARCAAPGGGDGDLVAPSSPGDSWTIAGNDSWDWFAASGFLQVLELPGPRGSRALILTEADEEPVHLLAWRPNRAGLSSSAALLAALARFARERSAPTLRIQPWPGIGGDGALIRACRLLAFVPRPPFTIYVRSAQANAQTVTPSPFFYATF
jgi:hypothetical protein